MSENSENAGAAAAWWFLKRQREYQMYNLPQDPMPPLRRLMMFIDGENLVMRYQEMLGSGRIPQESVVHETDTYVWTPSTWVPKYQVISRAIYYTYVQGDETTVIATSDAIRKMCFHQYSPMNQLHVTPGVVNTLYPKVYKKGKGKKAKGVDIQMTVDILTNVEQDNMDNVYLLSGDGDYKPVIEECIRRGKQVYISAFSSGLSDSLKMIADQLVCLDDFYFQPISIPAAQVS